MPEDFLIDIGKIPNGMNKGVGISAINKLAGPVIILSLVISFSFLALI